MATKEKNIWILLVFLLAGLVVGGLLGTAMMFVEFIGGFPNGLFPTLGACGA